MSTLSWPPKDPDEVLDYQLDWSQRLGPDTISSSTWLVVTGSVAIQSNSKTTLSTTVWLSGGEADEVCELLNRISTSGGRTMDQTVRLKIKTR
jgi:hypothetical protein